MLARVEREKFWCVFRRTLHVQLDARRLVIRERVERAGDLARNAGTHEHVVHAGEHRPIQRCEVGHLHLGEQIDSNHSVVPFFGQPDLHEIREHRHPLTLRAHDLLVHGERLVWRSLRAAVRQEIARQHPVAHRRDGEESHRSAHVTSDVSILKPANENGVHRRSRNDTQLFESRHGARKHPAGHANAHAALDDHGMRRRACGAGSLGHGLQAKWRTPIRGHSVLLRMMSLRFRYLSRGKAELM